MELFFDTETTGLPERTKKGLASYKTLKKYDTARIVSISWLATQNHKITNQAYYLIKPDNFNIPAESTAIHGITNEDANLNGCDINIMFEQFKEILVNCSNLVAHNIDFDINVLKSELYRYKRQDIIDILDTKNLVCTMKKGRDFLNQRTYPKLAHLYKTLYNEEMQNAHNAQYDTLCCYKCYIKMFPLDRSIFFFGDRAVNLTKPQEDIVYEDMNKDMLVIACAGSGKTTTMICRVKYLIDNGIPEGSIMVTTFTRDAANDMKHKLLDIMGYDSDVHIGTIDSIARRFSASNHELKDVSEYGYDFLNLLRSDPSLVSKYKYLFVDEFQDINDIQFETIKIFHDNGCHIFAVGDDAQNIYTFRGSNIGYILNFEKHFDGAITKYLMDNFRSTKSIIDMANACIEMNESSIPKKMVSGKNIIGDKPIIRYFQDVRMQNNNIVEKIKELLDTGVPEHEIAILCPINQPLYLIEEMLTRFSIKNVYLDGKSDVKTNKKLWHICLCTIHKSKGLEWDHVFLISMSDDIIPISKNADTTDESRRLFYVGITRARTNLSIYYCARTKGVTTPITRYVSEIPRDLYETIDMNEDCFTKSTVDVSPIELSVTKLIENLDGGDYIKLKESGIIPTLEKSDINITKIYNSSSYSQYIESEGLYSDFGIFIEKLIKREFACLLGDASYALDKHALMCLANVKLDEQNYKLYSCYKNNFKLNLKNVKPYIDNLSMNLGPIKKILERNCKPILNNHMQGISNIITAIKKNAHIYKLELHEVPVFSMNFLPPSFEGLMKENLSIVRKLDNTDFNSDITRRIWELSKCKKIVMEYRRRLLYKNIKFEDIQKHNEDLFQSIKTNLMDFFIKRLSQPVDVDMEKDMCLENGLHGEFDVRVGNTIIDYKTSKNDNIGLQWLVQLLCYKCLYEKQVYCKTPITKIGIINTLKGWYGEIDVSKWNKHNELISYLMNKSK